MLLNTLNTLVSNKCDFPVSSRRIELFLCSIKTGHDLSLHRRTAITSLLTKNPTFLYTVHKTSFALLEITDFYILIFEYARHKQVYIVIA